MAELHSERQGRQRKLPTADVIQLIWKSLQQLRSEGYFALSTGYLGREGGRIIAEPTFPDLEGYLTRRLRTTDVGATFPGGSSYPPFDMKHGSDALDLFFDFLEIVHGELIAKPMLPPHEEDQPGQPRYSPEDGQLELRDRVNPDLLFLDPPYELLANGQVVEKQPEEFDTLLRADVPASLAPHLSDPVDAAIARYRDRHSTQADRLAAVQQLANALEGMRGDVKRHLLSKDEGALFDIANNFGIRHLNAKQKLDYDKDIWLAWMFYVYLATIHAVSRLRERQQKDAS